MVDEPAESWYEALIVRMKAAREQAGYTQREVARTLNTSINTVSRWEIGATRAISITNLTALAALYLVSVGWLIGEEPAADEEERAVLAAMRKPSMPFVRQAVLAAARPAMPMYRGRHSRNIGIS